MFHSPADSITKKKHKNENDNKGISGVVCDSSGAGLPGATIQLIGNNGLVYTCVSDAAGAYNVPEVAPGNYTLQINCARYHELLVTAINLPDNTKRKYVLTLNTNFLRPEDPAHHRRIRMGEVDAKYVHIGNLGLPEDSLLEYRRPAATDTSSGKGK